MWHLPSTLALLEDLRCRSLGFPLQVSPALQIPRLIMASRHSQQMPLSVPSQQPEATGTCLTVWSVLLPGAPGLALWCLPAPPHPETPVVHFAKHTPVALRSEAIFRLTLSFPFGY